MARYKAWVGTRWIPGWDHAQEATK